MGEHIIKIFDAEGKERRIPPSFAKFIIQINGRPISVDIGGEGDTEMRLTIADEDILEELSDKE